MVRLIKDPKARWATFQMSDEQPGGLVHPPRRPPREGQVEIALHVQSVVVLAAVQGQAAPPPGGVALGMPDDPDRTHPPQGAQGSGQAGFGVPGGLRTIGAQMGHVGPVQRPAGRHLLRSTATIKFQRVAHRQRVG